VRREQLLHDRNGYAVNKTAISDELIEQQRRCDEIKKFGSDHSLDVSSTVSTNYRVTPKNGQLAAVSCRGCTFACNFTKC